MTQQLNLIYSTPEYLKKEKYFCIKSISLLPLENLPENQLCKTLAAVAKGEKPANNIPSKYQNIVNFYRIILQFNKIYGSTIFSFEKTKKEILEYLSKQIDSFTRLIRSNYRDYNAFSDEWGKVNNAITAAKKKKFLCEAEITFPNNSSFLSDAGNRKIGFYEDLKNLVNTVGIFNSLFQQMNVENSIQNFGGDLKYIRSLEVMKRIAKNLDENNKIYNKQKVTDNTKSLDRYLHLLLASVFGLKSQPAGVAHGTEFIILTYFFQKYFVNEGFSLDEYYSILNEFMEETILLDPVPVSFTAGKSILTLDMVLEDAGAMEVYLQHYLRPRQSNYGKTEFMGHSFNNCVEDVVRNVVTFLNFVDNSA